MTWMQRFSQIDIQQIIDQVSQGIIAPQDAVNQLRGLDVCGTIGSSVDSYGYLEVLSRMLQCPPPVTNQPDQPILDQPDQMPPEEENIS